MILETSPVWPSILLAVILSGDVILSVRPAKFIEKCLTGVKFPRQWWWALIYIKCVAIAGLVIGLWLPGIRIAALAGIVAYFFAAAFAHLKAKFTGTEFWLNCLGMLILSIVALLVTIAA
ncbi:DoxX family protein [Corynebacterium sp. HMSC076D02]|uniref:DoxX family protein n=1 Tax=Corynebacterium sp. HMSC076D02 TaxID=1739439 RepID=UPI0008A187AE|nr:DoxX family protein [Corynebacterium sp. HMSC076D02]OFQ45291.1 hypothetical protein HMPREF2935_06635 [Corynebacterium sp. HMSC076D02]